MRKIGDLFDSEIDLGDSEEILIEDRQIISPDGSRACVVWELRGKLFYC
ncbi:Uncharacterised protein [uncultured archaeon]|nr:Uncharacterised protein [uncultured archaeon]